MPEKSQTLHLQQQKAKAALASFYRKAKAAVNPSPAHKPCEKTTKESQCRRERPETVVVKKGSVHTDDRPPDYNAQWYRQMMQVKGISR